MVNFSLDGKVALVTGAAYGIGFAIAQALAEAGAKIAFNCRSVEHLEAAKAEYARLGIPVRGYICDVTKEDEVAHMVADIRENLGVIDILVNNAGIIKRIPMTEMSVDEFRQVIDIDLTAAFIMAKAVKTSRRNMVNTTSSAMASDRVISLPRRRLRSVRNKQTARVIRSIRSSSPRHRLPAGALRKT